MNKKKLKNKLKLPYWNPSAYIRIHDLPKSDHYREPLAELLGVPITIEGEFVQAEQKTVRGVKDKVTFMLLTNVTVREAPAPEKDRTVDHIWILCESDYVERNCLERGDKLYCYGKPYEYCRGDRRNIGIKMKKARLVTPKKKRKKPVSMKKKVPETELMMQMEQFIEINNITDFVEFSAKIRSQFPQWYEVLVRHQDYFYTFLKSVEEHQRIHLESTGKPPTEVFVCGKRIDLNTEDGKQQYSEQLEAVLTEVKCRLTSQAENFRFIIGDGVKLLGVQSNANNSYIAARKIADISSAYSYLDICVYKSGKLFYTHYQCV